MGSEYLDYCRNAIVKINEPYYHKRLAFEHEEEVRVIVSKKQYSEYTSFSEAAIHNNYNKQPNSTVDPIKRIIDASKSFDGRGEFYRRNFDNAIFIDIDDLSKYIAGIKVHPQAESWYVDLISKPESFMWLPVFLFFEAYE